MIRTEQAGAAMNIVAFNAHSLPAMIERAVAQLASATTAGEVLEARDIASLVYDAAKRAVRLAKAKGAHDELIAKAHRTQADALEIEAAAKRRLADEYDAAQDRGEVATGKDGPGAGIFNGTAKATAADLGLSRVQVQEAREIRDAEDADPGIVRRTLDAHLLADKEPTKASVRKAIKAVVRKSEAKDMEVAEQVTAPVKPNGPRINIPEGMTAEALARQGMALETEGFTSEDIAKQIGIATVSFRRMRDLVLLSDRGGLSERDTKTVASALSALNETQRISETWPLVEPIAAKVWGSSADSTPRAVREAKRLERFELSFGIIMQGCVTSGELDIPYLSAERAKKAVTEINAARRALSDLLNSIKGVHE